MSHLFEDGSIPLLNTRFKGTAVWSVPLILFRLMKEIAEFVVPDPQFVVPDPRYGITLTRWGSGTIYQLN